ncbi:hypothetical protein Nepgr_013488 [Nepenthes gracilis]|uniref:Uncharacterized protein n=1 Tax=Nepenthes gracilis TaxID=150966 RepID=A0AAD3SI87_NEPGR|nr:hypothetical protein Nepgr_013488 [Nepenthes gracilis]
MPWLLDFWLMAYSVHCFECCVASIVVHPLDHMCSIAVWLSCTDLCGVVFCAVVSSWTMMLFRCPTFAEFRRPVDADSSMTKGNADPRLKTCLMFGFLDYLADLGVADHDLCPILLRPKLMKYDAEQSFFPSLHPLVCLMLKPWSAIFIFLADGLCASVLVVEQGMAEMYSLLAHGPLLRWVGGSCSQRCSNQVTAGSYDCSGATGGARSRMLPPLFWVFGYLAAHELLLLPYRCLLNLGHPCIMHVRMWWLVPKGGKEESICCKLMKYWTCCHGLTGMLINPGAEECCNPRLKFPLDQLGVDAGLELSFVLLGARLARFTLGSTSRIFSHNSTPPVHNSANNSWPNTTLQPGAPVPHLQQPFSKASEGKISSTSTQGAAISAVATDSRTVTIATAHYHLSMARTIFGLLSHGQ